MESNQDYIDRVMSKAKIALNGLGQLKVGNLVPTECKYCSSSDIVKYGIESGNQYWLCKSCNRKFRPGTAESSRYPSELREVVKVEREQGKTETKIKETVKKELNINLSSSTVHEWIKTETKEVSRVEVITELQDCAKDDCEKNPDIALEEVFEKVCNILISNLKANSQETVFKLIPEAELGNSFDADMLIKAAYGQYLIAFLDSMPEFRKEGEGVYRLVENGKTNTGWR